MTRRRRLLAALALTASLTLPAAALQSSNLDLVTQTMQQALRLAMTDLSMPLPDAGAPSIGIDDDASHAANWLVEHLLTEELLARGFEVRVDDDGTEATRLTWRVVDLGIQGHSGLLGGSIERRSRVVVRLQLHHEGELLWTGDGHAEMEDRIPKGELDALQHARFGFARTDVEERTWGRYVEPAIVTSVLGSLVYLFFSNR